MSYDIQIDVYKLLDRCSIVTPAGCIIWDGPKNAKGYGSTTFSRPRRSVYIHRLMYELTKGNIPEGLVVCHTCDTRDCIQPDHLFIGTIQDNTMDMVNKGRNVALKGELAGAAKLTLTEVNYIKAAYPNETVKSLASRFSVHKSCIYKIIRGHSWNGL